MLKKTIRFTDLDGNEVIEDHYFHLSKADLVKLQVSTPGGLQEHLERVVKSEDGKDIIETFEMLIRESYGIRTDDGRFLKKRETAEEFMSSEAYSEFFMSLITDANAAAEFVNGVIPKGLDQEVAQAVPALSTPSEDLQPTPSAPAPVATGSPRFITQAEVAEMDSDELKSGLATGRYKLSDKLS